MNYSLPNSTLGYLFNTLHQDVMSNVPADPPGQPP